MARRRPLSPKEKLHADWIGMLQPEGLVVSVPVLVEADAWLKQPPEVQGALRALAPENRLPDRAAFDRLLTEVFGWPANRLADAASVEVLAVPLLDLGTVLRPDGALLDRTGRPLLYFAWSDGPLDQVVGDTRWPVTQHQRFERLLSQSQTTGGDGTAIGLQGSPEGLRLSYAPRGESPGSLTFPIEALCAWDGRILVDALLMLVGRDRLFTVAANHRLPELLAESRKRQEKVTVALAGQVEEALAILVAGVDVANGRTSGRLLRDLGADSGPAVRDGLVSFLLRTIFVLYCEDGGVRVGDRIQQPVLPMDHSLYLENYSLARLVERLEADQVLQPEAMRHRYGAWARMGALFRLVHAGVRHGDLALPPRHGDLFDPDKHPWLEGRATDRAEVSELPPIDDAVVAEVLSRLVYLEHQRLSYRNLDVEQIGSVYEALMALEVQRCTSRTVALRGDAWLSIADVLDADQPTRVIEQRSGIKERDLLKRAPALARFRVTGDRPADEARLMDALGPWLEGERPEKKPGQHVLVGGGERRRTGSHYTPSKLIQPIVDRTLAPVLGEAPSSVKILDVRVCDPAMGSGAFLAEACRYLARRLVDAWTREGALPAGDKGDPLLIALRAVAERCLFGVDNNPFAVQLARLSLWLVTLAKDKPFTFVDHALRTGDAVIGLTIGQIAAFDFEADPQQGDMLVQMIRRSIKDAVADRAQITVEAPLFDARDEHRWKQQYLTRAQNEVDSARTMGNLLLAVGWDSAKGKAAKTLHARVRQTSDAWFRTDGEKALSDEALALLDAMPVQPFHWELEFPEVFARTNGGFDAVVGNPPFGGKNTILANGGDRMIELHQRLRPHAHGNSDYSAWFFLRTASILRKGGCFGLVATNTIKQGDTRATGLQHLLTKGGITLYDATTDVPWSVVGGAAVVVDFVHGARSGGSTEIRLNGAVVTRMNSGLTAGDELPDPVQLAENASRALQGSIVLGSGFLLDPGEARALVDADPRNAEVVRPYMGGEELNNNPPGADGMVEFSRFVVDFGSRTYEEAASWPTLIEILRERVKPQRDNDKRVARRENWWMFAERAAGLYARIRPIGRCLATARVSKHHLFAFQPVSRVFSESLVIAAFADYWSFAILQSKVHEAWARHAGLGSTMKTDARYTPSTVFETFPFPRPTEPRRVGIALIGKALDEHRTLCMRRFGEGMTKIWNRMLDPDESDASIVALRDLRAQMDNGVLDAYGWADLTPQDTGEIVGRLRLLNSRRAREQSQKA